MKTDFLLAEMAIAVKNIVERSTTCSQHQPTNDQPRFQIFQKANTTVHWYRITVAGK
jgi:hypothetical protein